MCAIKGMEAARFVRLYGNSRLDLSKRKRDWIERALPKLCDKMIQRTHSKAKEEMGGILPILTCEEIEIVRKAFLSAAGRELPGWQAAKQALHQEKKSAVKKMLWGAAIEIFGMGAENIKIMVLGGAMLLHAPIELAFRYRKTYGWIAREMQEMFIDSIVRLGKEVGFSQCHRQNSVRLGKGMQVFHNE